MLPLEEVLYRAPAVQVCCSGSTAVLDTQQKVRHLIQVHNILILSKLGIHCDKPSIYLILDFLLEVSMKLYSI